MVFGKETKQKRNWNVFKVCCECGGRIEVKYNRGTQAYSKKNDWYDLTDKLENKGKYKCDFCLYDLYYNKPIDFSKTVAQNKKTNIIAYIAKGFIKKEKEN